MSFIRPLAIVLCMTISAIAEEGPSAADFDAQLARLTGTAGKDDRLAVAKYCRTNAASRHAERAVPALEKLIRNDPDAEVRLAAVQALTKFASRHKRPYPLVLVEAMWDKDEDVRQWAGVGMFHSQFEPGAIEALIAGSKDDRPDVRSACVSLLPRMVGKDARALAAINAAKSDKVFNVRHTAHCAHFKATDDLAGFLNYLIRLREDPDSVRDPLPADPETANVHTSRYNLTQIGSAFMISAWAESRGGDLADALLKLLDDKSVPMRRGAVNLIGASAVRVDWPPIHPPEDWFGLDAAGLDPLIPYLDPHGFLSKEKSDSKAGAKKADRAPPSVPQPSNVAVRLRKLKVAERLIQLRDRDPDESVRFAAWSALARLSEVPERLQVPPREVKR